MDNLKKKTMQKSSCNYYSFQNSNSIGLILVLFKLFEVVSVSSNIVIDTCWSWSTWKGNKYCNQFSEQCGDTTIPRAHQRTYDYGFNCANNGGSINNCRAGWAGGSVVADGDFVLYVSASNTGSCSGSTLA